jgi:hypothetical protein
MELLLALFVVDCKIISVVIAKAWGLGTVAITEIAYRF